MRPRLVHVLDGGERRVVMLTTAPCGAVVAAAVPATNWHAWPPAERAFASRIAEISAALRRGQSLRALAAYHEAMLELVEQLEAAESLAGAGQQGGA